MGTDYGKAKQGDIFYQARGYDPTGNNQGPLKKMSGKYVRSELGVGRLVLPINFDVSKKLRLGASFDIVWGGLDIQMDMGGQDFADVVKKKTGSAHMNLPSNLNAYVTQAADLARITGVADVINLGADGVMKRVNYARFDFSDDNPFTQATLGAGYAGKLGFAYQFSDSLTLGGSYHSVTKMGDFTGNASMSLGIDLTGDLSDVSNDSAVVQTFRDLALALGATADASIDMKGEIKVRDFQWPETLAFGAKWQPADSWVFTGDVKKINWSDVMKAFNLTFVPDITQGATPIDIALNQDWKDQWVYMFGAQWQMTNEWQIRGGYNYASNPVPSETLNPLFPAIVTTHYTVGAGWQYSKSETVDFSLVMVPEASQTNPAGTTTSMSQMNFQVQYSTFW